MKLFKTKSDCVFSQPQKLKHESIITHGNKI